MTGIVAAPNAFEIVGGAIDEAQNGRVMVLLINGQGEAPLRAQDPPGHGGASPSVADCNASMLPTKMLRVFNVAELVTCQNTLRLGAADQTDPAVRRGDQVGTHLEDEHRVGIVLPSSVSVPVRAMVAGDRYAPATRV